MRDSVSATMLIWKVETGRLYCSLQLRWGLINLSLNWRRLRLLTGYCGFDFISEVDCFAHSFGWRALLKNVNETLLLF